MQTKPVTDYERPKLPTHAILEEHPELLRLIPKRWQHNRAVLSALAALCVLASAGRAVTGQKASAARVAPIFQHGEGRGSFGCKVINPPVLLSEDEARQVIEQEAKRVGLNFGRETLTLPGVRVRTRYWDGKRVADEAVPLELDGRDMKRDVGYEYVSSRDTDKWSPPPAATAYSLSSLDRARDLRKLIASAKPAGAYAVFYDPMETAQLVRRSDGSIEYGSVRGADRSKLQERAREHLRAQVRDFIKWLKAQGVI